MGLTKDKEAIEAWEAKYVISSSSNLSDRAYWLEGLFYLNTESYKEAEVSFQKSTNLNNRFGPGWVGVGWSQFLQGKKTMAFDKALELSNTDIEAQFGKSFLHRQYKQIQPAIDILNHMITFNQQFLPVYIERMYVFMEMSNWDQVIDASQRLLGLVEDSIDGLAVICLIELSREGPTKSAVTYIETLFKVFPLI